MAIARVLAVKRFRRQLLRLKHPEVANWTEKQLKNAVFRNGKEWMDLLRWLLGELDLEIRECLCNCSDEERMSRIKESILVLGLSCPEKIHTTVQGRVIFKEREELVSQLIDLVKMKKAIDSGGTPCILENEGITTEDIQKAKNPVNSVGKDDHAKTEVLSGRELFDLLLEKHPEYQRLMLLAANEVERERVEGELSDDEDFMDTIDKMEALALMSDGASSLIDTNSARNQCAHPEDNLPINMNATTPKPKTGNCTYLTDTSPMLEVSELIGLKTTEQNIATKEVCSEDSALVAAKNEPSLSLGLQDGTDREDEVPIVKTVNKSGADAKPLNYLEAVHDLVNDLERTFHVSE